MEDTHMFTHNRFVRIFPVLVALMSLFIGCYNKQVPVVVDRPPPITAGDSPNIKTEIRDALVAYVEVTRKWHRSEYIIQIDGPLGELDGYMIGKISPAEEMKVGGGEFFVAYIDRKTLKVIRELHFQ